MPINLRDFFTPAVIAAQWDEVGSNLIDYIGPDMFPARKKAGLDLAWLKGNKGLPVSLMPSAFDAKATFRDRIGFEKLETEMPFFREGFKIKERDRQELLRVQDANDPYAQAIIDRVFDDANDLIASAAVVPERMIMQLLFPEDGDVGIAIQANGVDYTYNYDTDGSWKTNNYTVLTGTSAWTAFDTADPFASLQVAIDSVRSATGSNITTGIMRTSTFNLLMKSAAVKNRFLTTNGMTMSYLTRGEVAAVIRETVGLNIVLYDKQYKDESGNAKFFVPENYVCLVPDGALGSTWYGTTPEEADLMGSGEAEVSIVNTGVAITREVTVQPVNVNTFASEIVLPSYERMGEVAVLKVG